MASELAVWTVGADGVVAFAGAELSRYLALISGTPGTASAAPEFDSHRSGIQIGTAARIGEARLPDVDDPDMDDAYEIAVEDGSGWIAGSNPRSVLLGVYRYLTELGCRWVRPGPDGELLPGSDALVRPVIVRESASYRHRGVCIEGAVSEENVRDMVDWLPKVGMNAYFTQFREAFTFFERWYSHKGNPTLPPVAFTVDDARAALARVVDDIRQRGLMYHAVGHGWTCEPFGMPGLGWDYPPVTAPAESVHYLALVDGKRAVWEGIPLNTNLCYSNPEVRRIIVDDIAGYAEAHPSVDVLHFWLADGSNNHCECDACAAARPSDFYVRMLNEVDDELSARRLPTKVVFLIYVDLLWPPERERIANPDRFILMFAPITRSYSRPFSASGHVPELADFDRNKLKFPRSVDENVAHLRAWQQVFGGDSFDFDYHFMWDHYNDPGYSAIADILVKDIKNLASIGLDGLMSCQVQRAFFPTGLGMVAMARSLWNRDITVTEIEDDYFRSAFGPDGPKVCAYLSELSGLFDPAYLRGDKPDAGAPSSTMRCSGRLGFGSIEQHIADFAPTIQAHLSESDCCWHRSWMLLNIHADVCRPLARAYAARAIGNAAEARREWELVMAVVREREKDLQSVLDVCLFIQTLDGRFPPA